MADPKDPFGKSAKELTTEKELVESIKRLRDEEAKSVENIRSAWEKINAERLETFEAEKEAQAEILSNQQKRLDLAEKEIRQFEQKIRAGDKLQQKEDERRKAVIKSMHSLKEEIKLTKLRLKQQDELNKKISRQKKLSDDLQESTGSILQSITGLSKEPRGFVGKFLKTAQKDALGFEGAMNAVTSELKNFFTASNITRSVIEKVIESTITLAIAQDKVLSSFNKSSAAAGRYNDLIIDLERTHILYGVGTAEAAAVTGALRTEFNAFYKLSREQQGNVAGLAAIFQEMGTSGSTFAKSMDFATKALGQSVPKTLQTQRVLGRLAQDLDRSIESIVSDFSQMGPALAGLDDVVGTFADFEEIARGTGIEMSRLLSIVGQWETFEGATKAAGRLNALLGGDIVNSMELMTAALEDPDQAIRILQRDLRSAGIDWNNQSRAMQKAIASAAGFQDVGEFLRLMNGQLSESEDRANRMGLTQEEMNKIMAEGRSVMDELKILFMELAISIRPVVEVLKVLIHSFAWVIDLMRQGARAIDKLLGGTGLFTKALKLLAAAWVAVKIAAMANIKVGALFATASGRTVAMLNAENGSLAQNTRAWLTRNRAAGGLGGMGMARGLGMAGLGLMGAGAINASRGAGEAGSLTRVGGSALGGAMTGAAIGSFIPGVGTVIGGAVGGVIGGISGLFHDGGQIPGSGNQPIMAEGGEYVMKASAAKGIGKGNLEAMNKTGKIPSGGSGDVVAAIKSLQADVKALSSAMEGMTITMEDGTVAGKLVQTREMKEAINERQGLLGTSMLGGLLVPGKGLG